MSFSLSQWWHDFIDHLFKHPQAEQVAHPAIAAVAQAAVPNLSTNVPNLSTKPGDAIDPGKPTVTDLLFPKNPVLDARVGQTGDQVSLDPRVIYYDHHTVVTSGSFNTEPLKGKTRLSLTYTSQDAGVQAPTQGWVSENGGPEQGPMQLGVEGQWELSAVSGTASLSVRLDTPGRVIGQLFAG